MPCACVPSNPGRPVAALAAAAVYLAIAANISSAFNPKPKITQVMTVKKMEALGVSSDSLRARVAEIKQKLVELVCSAPITDA